MTSTRALIFGITGQDGSYLAELLLEKGYEVWGVIRRSSSFNTKRIDHIRDKLKLMYGDLTDSCSIVHAIQTVKPDEIYNLAAMSHVGISFNLEKYTTEVDALGCLYILQTLRTLGLEKKVKYYQASTSEMFGNSMNTHSIEKLTINSPMNPCSPYAIAKLYAHHMVNHYRKAYGMFVVSNVLMNHESPRRGENFVTQKIVQWAVQRHYKPACPPQVLQLGTFDSTRDWGHAKDYVKGIWLTLQQSTPRDYLLATGKQTSIREFITLVFKHLFEGQDKTIEWKGEGQDEKVYIDGELAIQLDPKYKRPNELTDLCGDPTEAEEQLGWTREYDLEDLVKDMIDGARDELI
jgi:GDPmannose 4,6-dehydratase